MKALEQVELKKPDLVICEQRLPDMTGIEFARTLREVGQTIPIIMVAATSDEKVMEEAKEAGVAHYVKKPFVVDELRSLVRELLEQEAPVTAGVGSTQTAEAESSAVDAAPAEEAELPGAADSEQSEE